MNSKSAVIIFMKLPVPGKVKTRLAKSIGDELACQAYQFLLKQTLVNIPSGPDLIVTFEPAEARESVKGLCEQYNSIRHFIPQPNGGLGERLESIFKKVFELGYQKVLAIGTDCPTLSRDVFQSAFNSLEENSIVLGPSNDGGYYLIGIKTMFSFLFRDMSWSTEKLYHETLLKIKENNETFHELIQMNDIDEIDDLKKLPEQYLSDLVSEIPEISNFISIP